ncbi:MAG: indolepyruvate oxidoreductase subunit beta [Negativicutes bacterium]|nr:indolepyruvate oxidoreductase subunit beta [Negativicutes bacterium]
MKRTILLVGVGGQGTILAAKVLAQVGLNLGMDVKMSEIHGMAQRGGSVVTQIKMAEKVYSPLIENGEADEIISFEKLEAQRYLPLLKKNGSIVYNDQEIAPMPVVIGAAQYPGNIEAVLAQYTSQVHKVAASQLAAQLGNQRAVNILLLGTVAAGWQDTPKQVWLDALTAVIPARYLELNRKAFEVGYQYGQ